MNDLGLRMTFTVATDAAQRPRNWRLNPVTAQRTAHRSKRNRLSFQFRVNPQSGAVIYLVPASLQECRLVQRNSLCGYFRRLDGRGV